MFYVVDISVIIIETVSAFMLMDGFLERKNTKIPLTAETVFFIIVFISGFIDGGVLITTLIFIIACIVSMIFFKGTIKKKVFVVLGVLIVIFSSEHIAGAFIMAINKISPDKLLQNNDFRLVGIAVSKIMTLFFAKSLSMLYGNKNYIMYKKYWLALLTIPLVNIMMLLSIIYFFEKLTPSAVMPMALSVIGILYTNILVFYLFDRIMNSFEVKLRCEMLENQMEVQDNKMRSIEKENKKIISVKHDFKNHCQMIYDLLKGKHYEYAKKYIADMGIVDDTNTNIIKTGNISVDSIINFKLSQAKENNINVILNIKPIPNDLKFSGIEACMLFGNLFDNAIEGVGDDRQIEFGMAYQKEHIFIEMKNRTKNNVKFKDGIPVTTKNDDVSHGIGIQNILNVVNTYNGIYEVKCEDGTFRTDIVLFNI